MRRGPRQIRQAPKYLGCFWRAWSAWGGRRGRRRRRRRHLQWRARERRRRRTRARRRSISEALRFGSLGRPLGKSGPTMIDPSSSEEESGDDEKRHRPDKEPPQHQRQHHQDLRHQPQHEKPTASHSRLDSCFLDSLSDAAAQRWGSAPTAGRVWTNPGRPFRARPDTLRRLLRRPGPFWASPGAPGVLAPGISWSLPFSCHRHECHSDNV